MNDFMFYNPTRLVLGKGAETQAGQYAKQYGATKVMLLYGGGSIKKNGVLDRVTKSLTGSGVSYVEMGGVAPNAPLSTVRKGIDFCRREKADFVLAIGGGSVIDSAKAIAAGAVNDTDIWDFFIGKAGPVKKSLPLGVVLTIPASGSESNTTSAIFHDTEMLKRGSFSEAHYPAFALMNPEICYTLPPYQIASGTCDILSHMMERYFTNVPHNDFTDRLLEGGMRSVIHNALIVTEQPDNYDAWAEICFAGTIAHNGLLDSGRGMCFGVHAIELALTAVYDHISHGAGIALVYPAWMKYCKKHKPERFVQFAVKVMGVDMAFENQEAIIDESIRRLEEWYTKLGLELKLSKSGVDENRLREIAENTTGGGQITAGHFVELNTEDVYQILKLAH